MGRIKDLNSALPTENDAFVFDGANGTKRLSYAEFKQKLIDDGFGSGSSEAVVLTQAEYDALPDEVKDSDTIFFISDAPFENSNVVTLTRAQYDALSDATKMDGRFYYITDEEEVAKSLVVQTNVNSTETVPSSAVVYGLSDSLPKRIASATKSGSVTLAFPTNSLNVIWTAGNMANEQTAVFSVNTTTSGYLGIVDIRTATQVSYTTDGYNATITNSNTGNGLRICCINLYGDFPTEV